MYILSTFAMTCHLPDIKHMPPLTPFTLLILVTSLAPLFPLVALWVVGDVAQATSSMPRRARGAFALRLGRPNSEVGRRCWAF